MNIEKTESLFSNDKEYLTIVEGITKDDVIVKTSHSEKNVDRAVDAKYSFDRSLWMSVYVVLKPEIVETLRSINPQLLKAIKLSQILREESECYNMHETHRVEFKFTGIRTRKKKIEKYDGIYDTFIQDIPRITEIFTNKLLDIINDYLEGQVSKINERYTKNHVELFTDDTYEDAWKKAKKPVWSHWTGTEIPPSDDTAVSNALFKNGRADYGFKRVKDAKKVAEWIALWETFQHGFGILNHSDSHMNIFYQL